MDIALSYEAVSELQKIEEIRKRNFKALQLFSSYLVNCPRFITSELIESITCDCGVSEEYAFRAVMKEACGLDEEKNRDDIILSKKYFDRAIQKLDTAKYKKNPYLSNIKIPEMTSGSWCFQTEKYRPYEAFVFNDIILEEDFSEIPQIGFFNEQYRFPAILENGNEWMLITPNEIETMQPVIDEVRGNIVTFGLGLGYFAYMAAQKESVENITIIERDENAIRLFQKYILPQFQNSQKITVIREDAFSYVKSSMSATKKIFDYAFVDIWNDPSNGVPLYLKMNKLEALHPKTKFLYWIERSLLSHIRWIVFNQLLQTAGNGNSTHTGGNLLTVKDIKAMLSDEGIKKLALHISMPK